MIISQLMALHSESEFSLTISHVTTQMLSKRGEDLSHRPPYTSFTTFLATSSSHVATCSTHLAVLFLTA